MESHDTSVNNNNNKRDNESDSCASNTPDSQTSVETVIERPNRESCEKDDFDSGIDLGVLGIDNE